jgi:hypothetical protein
MIPPLFLTIVSLFPSLRPRSKYSLQPPVLKYTNTHSLCPISGTDLVSSPYKGTDNIVLAVLLFKESTSIISLVLLNAWTWKLLSSDGRDFTYVRY